MAKRGKSGNAAVDAVAEAAGSTLGRMVEAIDALRAEHPDPVAEVKAALTQGLEKLKTVKASAQKTAAVTAENVTTRAKAAVRRVQDSVPSGMAPSKPKPRPKAAKAAKAAKATKSTKPTKRTKPAKSAKPKTKVSKRTATRTVLTLKAANAKRRQALASSTTRRKPAGRAKKR